MKNPFRRNRNFQELAKEYGQTLANFDHLINIKMVTPDYEEGVMRISPTILENQSRKFKDNWAMRAWIYLMLKGEKQYEEVKLLDWETDEELWSYEPPKEYLANE